MTASDAATSPSWQFHAPAAVHMSQTELGIGDILCSMYGVYGYWLAHGGPRIRLFLRDHFEWLSALAIPQLEVLPYRVEDENLIQFRLGDDEAGYRAKLSGGHAPKQWYADKLGVAPAAPPLNLDLLSPRPEGFERPYVIVAPYATRINRTWEIHNWRLLARRLGEAGYEVIALDAPHQPERCAAVGGRYFWGQPPLWTLRLCWHASLIISNDSGLAHVGGLLDRPTLVLLSQQDPAAFFSMTRNQFIVPKHSCVACRFQPQRGYTEKCDFGCWALQSIDPDHVAAQALQMLGASRSHQP